MTNQRFVQSRYDRVKQYDTPVNQMKERGARKIPSVRSVGYDEVVTLDMGFLFCDIKGYTKLVDKAADPKTIARIMSIYVTEMGAAIRHHGGRILSIRGDGIIGAFTDTSDYSAPIEIVRCFITMKTVLQFVINKRLRSFRQDDLTCRWGADFGKIKMTKAGIRGEDKNDLVYIGKAMNYAAKFSDIADSGTCLISTELYTKLDTNHKNWKWTSRRHNTYGSYYVCDYSNWKDTKQPS